MDFDQPLRTLPAPPKPPCLADDPFPASAFLKGQDIHMPRAAMILTKKKRRLRFVCLLESFFGLETEAKLYKAKA